MPAIVRPISACLFFLFAVAAAEAAQDDWPTYRHDNARTGAQPVASDLADPVKISGLHIVAHFPPDGSNVVAGAFAASPIVVDGTAFIGDVNGYFYAFEAATGKPKWQFPKAGDPPLSGAGQTSSGQICPGAGNYSFGQYGIRTGATFAVIGNQPAVIFGAPDPAAEFGLGSARLFAFPLSADPNNPQPIWTSDVVAHMTGCTSCTDRDPHSNPTCRGGPAYTEQHERIAYSSPLVLGNTVYVGIHDSGDSPIQQGHVVAVDLNTNPGHIIKVFQFLGAGNSPGEALGGSVWNALASDGTGVFFTTGNTHDPWCVWPYTNCSEGPEPQPNNGLSMLRVDKDTGSVVWKYQPVPFAMDGDPDWAAGATVMKTSCGELIASVQKDGWSYAIDANQPNRAPSCPLSGHSWQFPSTTNGCPFKVNFQHPNANLQHGDDDYRRPGAAWNDVFIVRTGGEANTDITGCQCEDGDCMHGRTACRGYSELHALNACAASEQDRVRWIGEIPNNTSPDGHVSYSSPTVTGGLVFIGTNQDPTDPNNAGHLVVLADPSVVGASQQVCSNFDVSVSDCAAPYAPVWSLQPLVSIAMPDGGSAASMRNEPVLAEGRVFVATSAGHVYILAPGPGPGQSGLPFPDREVNTIVPEILAPDSVPTIIDGATTIIE